MQTSKKQLKQLNNRKLFIKARGRSEIVDDSFLQSFKDPVPTCQKWNDLKSLNILDILMSASSSFVIFVVI